MNEKEFPLIAPSLLSADFSRMKEGLLLIESSGGDWVHFDVMDGAFVPNITFGHKMVADMRKHSSLPFDVHLMINKPENHVEKFALAGATFITVHAEASIHLHRLICHIKEQGVKAGVSIVPSTPANSLLEVLPFVDLILVMTVNPGFGGQKLIPQTLSKVEWLREMKEKKGYTYLLEVDGGVNEATADTINASGADVIVTGSAFFSAQDPQAYVKLLKGKRL